MERSTAILGAVIGFSILGAAALYFRVEHIVTDIQTRAQALVAQDAPWVQVEVNGQHLTVTGAAPDEVQRDLWLAKLGDMEGVVGVEDATQIEAPPVEIVIDEPVARAIAVPEMQPSVAVHAPLQTTVDPISEPERQLANPVVEPEAIDHPVASVPSSQADQEEDVEATAVLVPTVVTECQDRIDQLVLGTVIEFEFGRTRVAEASKPLLDRLAPVLIGCEVAVEVAGHTDSSGHPMHNLQLSRDRAKAVVRYLADRGVPSQRLIAQGYGADMPRYDNNTREGRRKNRRIEFVARLEG